MNKFKLSNGSERMVSWDKEQQTIDIDGQQVKLALGPLAPGAFHALVQNKSIEVQLIQHNTEKKTIELLVNGKNLVLTYQSEMDLLLEKMGLVRVVDKKLNETKAPMPGLVLKILVAEGERVSKGQTLLLLEAMKMENTIKAAGDAVVKSIEVKQGEAVEKNQLLIRFA